MGSLTAHELTAFAGGQHTTLYRRLGAHPDERGCSFALWAPEARAVRVVGEFAPRGRMLERRRGGVWTGRARAARLGHWYRYEVETQSGKIERRVDPFAISFRDPAAPEAVIFAPSRRWRDGAWMRARQARQAEDRPLSIYEVHLGSWRRSADNRFLGYRQAAKELAEHVLELGFTHVELLPLAEHPFYGSWGYQATGCFAPTARYGSPADLMAAIETFHRAGIGVILDWVPSHFAGDPHGLARFGGSCLFEHPDPSKGHHPDWKSPVFNYDSGEVRSFLLSSARWWLETFHVDGLRVDAVASMLYLDYSRAEDEWEPNEYGGRENLAALEFLRALNAMVDAEYPGALVIAEESTAWPGVTRPHYLGGLGFDLKWDMGWMNDTLRYMRRDPIHRGYHHNDLTFRMLYAFSERFLLSLSHDEVVHMKGSLAGKMPGTDDERLGAAGQEAAVHGRRARPVVGVGPRRRARLGASAQGPASRRPAVGERPQPTACFRGGASSARLRAWWLLLGRRRRQRAEPGELFALRRARSADSGGGELHLAALAALPLRRASARSMEDAPEQRRAPLRRWRRPPREARRRAAAGTWLCVLARARRAAVRDGVGGPGRLKRRQRPGRASTKRAL
jgi:1,4-alpha-glucan branching enzyme